MAWIETNSSKKFNFNRVTAKDICLEDIAHSLSYTCRYNGHAHAFYRTAEHCLNMAEYFLRTTAIEGKPTEEGLALADQALLHDSAEAYCGDMVSPLKQMMPEFKAYEEGLMRKILRKYKLPQKLDKRVKEADVRILLNEKAKLFPPDGPRWELQDVYEPLEGVEIHCFTPPEIYPAYLQVLKERFGQYD